MPDGEVSGHPTVECQERERVWQEKTNRIVDMDISTPLIEQDTDNFRAPKTTGFMKWGVFTL
jgi:hypothetical protein